MPAVPDRSAAGEAGGAPVKIICWNIGRRHAAWRCLLEMDADLALLQEAGEPPPDVAERVEADPGPWRTPGSDGNRPWRAAVAQLSDRVEVEWIESKSLTDAEWKELGVSRPGSLAAAHVKPQHGEPFIVVSLYALWESPHSSTDSSWGFVDASAHRLISDLSRFIGAQRGHRVIAAGDLNTARDNPAWGPYWAARDRTVFDRMEALGLPCVGPEAPHGRQADPWPDALPRDSKNVPTYHHNKQTPAEATIQGDFVFASWGMMDSVQVRALNDPEQWGPSDHCRVEIEVS